MNIVQRGVSIGVVSIAIGCGRFHAPPPAPAATAEIFAPGIVSTAAPEFAVTFSRDGRTTWFDRASPDRSRLTIMTSEQRNGTWAPATVAPFSGVYRDVDPFMAPDGARLYFSSDRPRRAGGGRRLHTWYVDRAGRGWSTPRELGRPVDSDSDDVFFSVSRGGFAVLRSTRDGHPRVYGSQFTGGRWSLPVALRFGTVEEAGNPLISPDGRFMLLVIERPATKADLLVSCRSAGGWSAPRPLSDAVNSRYAEFAPALGPRGMLYFTSERPGMVAVLPDSIRPPGDIYRISLAGAGVRCGRL